MLTLVEIGLFETKGAQKAVNHQLIQLALITGESLHMLWLSTWHLTFILFYKTFTALNFVQFNWERHCLIFLLCDNLTASGWLKVDRIITSYVILVLCICFSCVECVYRGWGYAQKINKKENACTYTGIAYIW